MDLSPAARQAMDRLAADLTRVFSDRFVALVAYGPTRSAAFARSIRAADLEALSALADRWQLDGLETPLLITPDEFTRSLDAFPVEPRAAASSTRRVLVPRRTPSIGGHDSH